MTVQTEFASIDRPTDDYPGDYLHAEQVQPGVWLIEGDREWAVYISLERAATLPERFPRRQWYFGGDRIVDLEEVWNVELKFSDPKPSGGAWGGR